MNSEWMDKVKRWENACADGLSEVATAIAVGEHAGNLFQWQKDPKVYSRRPKKTARE